MGWKSRGGLQQGQGTRTGAWAEQEGLTVGTAAKVAVCGSGKMARHLGSQLSRDGMGIRNSKIAWSWVWSVGKETVAPVGRDPIKKQFLTALREKGGKCS